MHLVSRVDFADLVLGFGGSEKNDRCLRKGAKLDFIDVQHVEEQEKGKRFLNSGFT